MKIKLFLSLIVGLLIIFTTACSKDNDNSDSIKYSSASIFEESLTENSDTAEIQTNISEETTISSETETVVFESTTIQNDNLKPSEIVLQYSPDDLPDFIKEFVWTEDMVINSEDEIQIYFDNHTSQMITAIPYILTDSCKPFDESSDMHFNNNNIMGYSFSQVELTFNKQKYVYGVCYVGYFTSAYIINAYQTGDTSDLNSDNMAVYNKAVDFIDNVLNKELSYVEQEKQICDYICDLTTYYTTEEEYTLDNIPRYRMAAGVMLDGCANCMGYTDAFYMLATMAGFDVEKVDSDESMKHTWNVITLNNKKYLVDTTWMDSEIDMENGQMLNIGIYFNAPLDVIRQEYRYDWNNQIMQQLEQTIDENYFYLMNRDDFGYMTNTYDEFYSRVSEFINSGKTSFQIACRNNVAGDTDAMFTKILNDSALTGTISGTLKNIEGYSFAYISYVS